MSDPRFRAATTGDAAALTVLERVANLAALGHVFDQQRYPFPTEALLERWEWLLIDPDVSVRVVGGRTGLECLVAYDAALLRQLAVRPERWGTGLGRAAVELAVESIRAAGGVPHLWCLRENHRARGMYEHLGWVPTGAERELAWPPHPVELEYVLQDEAHG